MSNTDEYIKSRAKIIFLLIVDDEYTFNHPLIEFLTIVGLEVDYVPNGIQALDAVKNQLYDLILTDISMPDMDGYELAISIRSTPNPNQNTPIIGFSAFSSSEAEPRCTQVGMNGYIKKPIKSSELLEKLQYYIKPVQINNDQVSAFATALDKGSLSNLYGNDTEYAKQMFSIFLTDIVPEVRKMLELCLEKKVSELYALAHKLKPTLYMVGLTNLQDKMDNIEKSAAQNIGIKELETYCKNFIEELNAMLPTLEKELKNFTQESS